MSGWAVVAIPAEDDYVWRISSEKIPHLTLLYLGDQPSGPQMAQIEDYVGHATNTSLRRFGLQVDRRGMLGADNADVLFFDRYGIDKLEQFRAFLLKNPILNQAYLSTEQYETWTPHLTLGYPTAPAKPDTRDYARFSWVDFDRIAVWFGDFDGPEFVLKRYDDLPEVAMSDRTSTLLEHHGVKGMHWGVRRTREQIDADSEDVTRAKGTKAIIKSNRGSTDPISNSDLQHLVNRMNLEQQYSRLTAQPTKLQKGHKAVKEILGAAKTAQEVYNLTNGPLAKDIRKNLDKK